MAIHHIACFLLLYIYCISKEGSSLVNAALSRDIQGLLADLEKRFPYASAFWMKTEGTEAMLDRRDQSISSQDPNAGIVFSIFNGSYFEEFASSEVDSGRLVRAVKNWASELPRLSSDAQRLSLQEMGESKTFVTAVARDPAEVTVQEKLQLLRELQERAQ